MRIALLSSVLLLAAVVTANTALAQNVSQWNGTYRCIPSATHCAGGWDGEIRVANGNIWGNVAVTKDGTVFRGSLNGRIDAKGNILNTEIALSGPDGKQLLQVEISGPLWEAIAQQTTRKIFRGVKREVFARLRFVEPARFAEIEVKNRGQTGQPTRSAVAVAPAAARAPTRVPGCETFVGNFAVRQAADDISQVMRSGGGCLDEAGFSVVRRAAGDWVEVRLEDGQTGYLELSNPSLTAYVAAALTPASTPTPTVQRVATTIQSSPSVTPAISSVGSSTCAGELVTYAIRQGPGDTWPIVTTGAGCVDSLDLVFIARIAGGQWYAVRLSTSGTGFVDVGRGGALAALAERQVSGGAPVSQQAQRPPVNVPTTQNGGPCGSGVSDYTVRALPNGTARELISGNACLDDLQLDIISQTSRPGWYLVRLPDGRSGFVNTSESVAMAALVGAERTTAEQDEPAVQAAPPTDTARAPILDPIDQRYIVINNANVRERPEVRAPRVTTLTKGDAIVALGKVRGADWILVARDGASLGYVFAPLLGVEGSPEALAAVAPAPPQRAPSVAENRHAVAVIIGNRRYGGDIPEVTYAHNDADALKRHVVETLGYRDGNIIDLRDATLADFNRVFGTERNRRATLANWIREGRSDVTVFYSGHGVPGLNDRRGYLLPVDGDPNLAELTGYSLDTLLANLALLPARSVQIFLDACFSGSSAGGSLLRATSGIGLSAALPDAAPSGVVVITAASGDQVASWDDDARHGLFTRHLLAALNGAADGGRWGNSDGRVTLGEVKTYLDDEMTFQARKRFNREQTANVTGGTATVVATVR
ncbi:MAG: caspase family protein [Proteobacteria bacterium]|nr:caspase family protein [Pseudomonadota bacterium]MDA1059556.1 caspase family protein [Pseudomonadota bacterium]